MATITMSQIISIYQNALAVNDRKTKMIEAITNMTLLGMHQKSARMYLVAAIAMLEGTHYGSTINEKATVYFLDRILDDFGADGLKRALTAMKSHLDYQTGRNNLPGLVSVYNKYSKSLG